MPKPHWSDAHLTIAATLAALPFGYGLGIAADSLLAAGYGIDQAWLVTVPLSLLAAIAVAYLPLLAADMRFLINGIGAIAAIDLHLMAHLLAAP